MNIEYFTPLSEADRILFAAVMSGEFALNGFRNSDLAQKRFAKPTASAKEAKKRSSLSHHRTWFSCLIRCFIFLSNRLLAGFSKDSIIFAFNANLEQ